MNLIKSSVRQLEMSLAPDTKPVVFVIHDNPSVRRSIDAVIRRAAWQPIIVASAQEFLSRPRLLVPNCLILDVRLPDIDGLDLQRRIAADRSDLPVIFVTSHGDVTTAVQAMKAGAMEFLTKPFLDEVLLRSIQQALELSEAALFREAQIRILKERYDSLSRREREVMALVVCGRLNKQVGGELGISEITVKQHRGRVMQKMKSDSLATLVNMAATLHILPISDIRLVDCWQAFRFAA